MRPFNSLRARPRTGFSLVELLVVIAIIAVLVAMLLPALQKARQSVQTVQCLSNMRQMYAAIRMYSNDNDGMCTPSAYSTFDEPLTGYWIRIGAVAPFTYTVPWQQSAAHYLLPRSRMFTGGVMMGQKASVWNCPAGPNPENFTNPMWGGFGINRNIGGLAMDVNGDQWVTVSPSIVPANGQRKTQPLTKVRRQTEKYLLLDAGAYIIGQGNEGPGQLDSGAKKPAPSFNYIPGYVPAIPAYQAMVMGSGVFQQPFTRDYRGGQGRHAGKSMVNVVFVDGHGETVSAPMMIFNNMGWSFP